MGQRLIPYETLREMGITFSKPHLYRLEKQNQFPRRIYIGGGDGGGRGRTTGRTTYAYDAEEIATHIECLKAARDNDAASARTTVGGKQK